MRKIVSLLSIIVCVALPQAALAADTLIGSAVVTSGTSAQSSQFDCGVQISVRCKTTAASYRVCDGATGATCTAVAADLELSVDTTYDIPVASPSSSAAQCRVAFITAGGAGTCSVYRVVPRTIPSNL